MSRKNTIGPEYFRMRDDERLMRTHEAMVDFINERPTNRSFLDALSFGYEFVPELDRFAAQFTGYEDSSDEDYYDYDDDNDKYDVRTNNRYCGFSQNFLDRGLPKPSKHITAEEAERNAKELVDEEEKLKKKAEKKKQKKMRQKERRRLEKLEKENADKEKNKPVQVDPGPEKTKHADKDENENKIKNKNCSSVTSGLQHTSKPVESSDSSNDDEDEEEEPTMEPEELDMNSCFVSNAAAIAKRKLEQKPKPDKKPAQANSRKQRGSEQKGTTTPQKPVGKDEIRGHIHNNKEEEKSEETVNANYFITRSVELAVIGNQYADAGNLEMAVTYFTDAIKHNPKEYKLFGNRSYCYEKMLEYEKALTDADIALSMNPKWIKGLYRKGKALVGLKRYFEARLTYNEVLKLNSGSFSEQKEAAEELMRVQIMQLMEMGFTKEQSSNALILHGTVEIALEALSGIRGLAPVLVPAESEFMSVERHPKPPAKFPLRPLPLNQPRPSMPVAAPVRHHAQELFPIWVGDLVPSITEAKLYGLFSFAGQVHSVRVLQMRHCAFVNYTKKEDSEKAIQDFHGYAIDGTTLVVRYPDRIHTRLGVSRDASTESSGKIDKQPDECYFWRTTGCLKNDRCTYKHIPENKGIERHNAKSHP
ncbi:tetratricopeptide repeat protein 31 [Rhinichthys klamathensis goyatoka]|uniref:tetratricopeptide repeat protein 31 n=1 Tax=Rhinichthys klamathensis goyatoka TaxID=3034132 RepID=UPI0024B50BA2|nr:tetratricopeptide repeat protein 31 [Rhinichthys klamathensis goyatoka]